MREIKFAALVLAAFGCLCAPAFPQSSPGPSATGDPWDQVARIPRIHIGPLIFIGEDHPLFNLSDFKLHVQDVSGLVSAHWVERSIVWVRLPDGLPMPLARLRVSLAGAAERGAINWRGRTIAFEYGASDSTESAQSSAELFIPLLDAAPIAVSVDGKSAAEISIEAQASSTPMERRHAIDHSCSPWQVQIQGLDDAFVSMNCRMIPVGRVGQQTPLLDIHWAVAGAGLPRLGASHFQVQLRSSEPARLTLTDAKGQPRVVEISAQLPERAHIFNLWAGAGPYSLTSNAGRGQGAVGLLFYGNLRLRPEDDLSIRAFEAAISQSPGGGLLFNNFGLYLGYDAAQSWDNRLRLNTLLGGQAVTLSPNGLSHKSVGGIIYPQGFEVSYLDCFGLRNKKLTVGAFFQPSQHVSYQNYWLRFGGDYFGEFNYISWQSGNYSTRTWGLSVGVPLAKFF